MPLGSSSAVSPRPSYSTTVLAVYQSNYTNEHDNFTVSMAVSSTVGIQYVYFTFCQLSSPICYLPVFMSLHGSHWYVGTTNPMTTYHGMTVGVQAGYNITILYNDNSTQTEPAIPNPFPNLSISTSVTGEYMYEMTVNPDVYGLSGIVADAVTGVGVPGAHVSLTPANNSTLLGSTTTSATGAYSFSQVVNGSYKLWVTGAGYRSFNETVGVAGQNTVQDIALTNASASTTGPGGAKAWYSASYGGLTLPEIGVVVLVAAIVVGILAARSRRGRRGESQVTPAASSESPSDVSK